MRDCHLHRPTISFDIESFVEASGVYLMTVVQAPIGAEYLGMCKIRVIDHHVWLVAATTLLLD